MFEIRHTDLISKKIIGTTVELTEKSAKYAFGYAKKVATRKVLIEMFDENDRLVRSAIVDVD